MVPTHGARASDPAWLSLYLSACKLLDLVTTLPADLVPQFQLYRWAFIGEQQHSHQSRSIRAATVERSGSVKDKEAVAGAGGKSPTFVPHIHKLAVMGTRKFFGGVCSAIFKVLQSIPKSIWVLSFNQCLLLSSSTNRQHKLTACDIGHIMYAAT